MPCYHPKIRIEDITKWEKAADGHLYHPARILKAHSEYDRLEDLKNSTRYRYSQIPCRNCIGCRLDYSRQWADRGYLEAKYHDHNYFVTLTYDEIHLPITNECQKGTLCKEDITDFLHDLRQIMKREYNHQGIKFMLCGEYGEEGERPHYHAILYNLPLPSETFYKPRIINHETYFQNTIIERAWTQGISNITEASWNNIAYTARYITKKVNGERAKDQYIGRIPEFFRCSKGIAKQAYQDQKENVYINEMDEIHTTNKSGNNTNKPPKYWDRLYEKENKKHLEKIKKKRHFLYENKQKVKDKSYSDDRLKQIGRDERAHAARALRLRRDFEVAKEKSKL